MVAPTTRAKLEPIIRERCVSILESLPLGETFNWVDKVSIELTTQMLATLFDFPFEERRKLTYWSDVSTSTPDIDGLVSSDEERERILWEEILKRFDKVEVVGEPERNKSTFIKGFSELPVRLHPVKN